jgi:hypothetical protein
MTKKLILFALALIVVGSLLGGNIFSVYAQEVEEEAGEIDHVEVSPEEVTLEKGSGQQFHAHAYDTDGNQVDFTAVWATTGGTITQDGFYAASQGGCHQVFAIDELSGVTGEATVVVTCGEEGETCLAVIPGRVTMQVGEQVQFSVYEKTGSGIGQEVSCNWYASGGGISSDGLFTAEKLGSYSVTAVNLDTGKMGSAHVVVEEHHLLPWWAFTMMGSEYFWVVGVLGGLVVGLVVYILRRNIAQNVNQT